MDIDEKAMVSNKDIIQMTGSIERCFFFFTLVKFVHLVENKKMGHSTLILPVKKKKIDWSRIYE